MNATTLDEAFLDRPLVKQRANALEHTLGTVSAVADGVLIVDLAEGRKLDCELLLTGALPPVPGDRVLVLAPTNPRERGVVLGCVGACPSQAKSATICLEASQQLSLRCGESSIDLRADGKVLIRGDDVLVRAKGTQRIRAGTVSIN